MVQSALLFALGFMVATLLALLLAPVVWRRAQWLMRHRLEAVVPMTLDEVRADRDALRAQHAMAMRRLEVENDDIRRIDAEHMLEISRGREELKARAATIAAREARIGELDREVERLAAQIRLREKELASLEVSHRVASREVVAKRARIESLILALSEAERIATERRDIIAARDTTDSERSDELSAARRDIGTARQRESALSAALTAAQAELREERSRVERLERDLRETDEDVRTALADLAAKVVRLNGGLPSDHPDTIPTGRIAARLDEIGQIGHRAPANGAEPDPEEKEAERGDGLPADDDDLMAEMDAAALEMIERPANGRPEPANDEEPPAAQPTRAREGQSPSQP